MKLVEKNIVKNVKELTKEHLLWILAANVKGLGDVGVMTLLGYIDTEKVTSAGKAKAYFSITPEHGNLKGQNHKYNHKAKGRLYGIIVKGVIMAKDPLYYRYYLRMKKYYATRKDWVERKDEPAWKSKIDHLAKRKVAALIISHATEVMRQNEGLDISAWKSHHDYNGIPGKTNVLTRIYPTHIFLLSLILRQA